MEAMIKWVKSSFSEFNRIGWQLKVLVICIFFLILFAISHLIRITERNRIDKKVISDSLKIEKINEKIKNIIADSANVARHDSVLRANGIEVIKK